MLVAGSGSKEMFAEETLASKFTDNIGLGWMRYRTSVVLGSSVNLTIVPDG